MGLHGFLKRTYGFSSNSNPAAELHYCSSFENDRKNDNYLFYCSFKNIQTSWIEEGLFPSPKPQLGEMIRLCFYHNVLKNGIRPFRNEDGSIDFPQSGKKNRNGASIKEYANKRILMLISSLGGGGSERGNFNTRQCVFKETQSVYPSFV